MKLIRKEPRDTKRDDNIANDVVVGRVKYRLGTRLFIRKKVDSYK